uniref:Uncharacterized protein n=1 Tax=Lepeophtheirus salmonis TaxID=72036 RepID=A0A0K2TIT8_LEPSM
MTLKCTIPSLHLEWKSSRTITKALNDLNVSKLYVHYSIKRAKDTGSVDGSPRSDRPRSMSSMRKMTHEACVSRETFCRMKTPLIFISEGVKVNQRVYLKLLQSQILQRIQ